MVQQVYLQQIIMMQVPCDPWVIADDVLGEPALMGIP